MIIDSHAHVGPVAQDERHRAIIAGNPANSVEDYLRDMDDAGVDMGVTFGYLDLDNDYQASIQNKHPDRIVSLAWCNPRQLNCAEEFRRCVEDLGIRGLKLHGWWHQHANSDHLLLDPFLKSLMNTVCPWLCTLWATTPSQHLCRQRKWHGHSLT